jgi:hypothetical protein
MHTLFVLAKVYPYWAIPLALVVGELGIFFRRRRSKKQRICWAGVGILLLGLILWFYFRGDLNSDRWIQSITENF